MCQTRHAQNVALVSLTNPKVGTRNKHTLTWEGDFSLGSSPLRPYRKSKTSVWKTQDLAPFYVVCSLF